MAPGFPAQVIADVRASAKAYTRVTLAEDDALFDAQAAAALGVAEAFLRTSLIVRTHRAVLPAAGGWRRLPATPVTVISGLAGMPMAGAEVALAADAYAIDIDAAGDGWVRVVQPDAYARVAVTYAAGLAPDWAGVPAPIAHGVVRLIGHLYAERDGGPPPAAVTALWRPFRRLCLHEARR